MGGLLFILFILSLWLAFYGFHIYKTHLKWKKQFEKDCRLIDAIDYGDDLDQIKAIVRDGANINGTDENGDTPLIWSVRKKREDLTAFFVACCANVHQKNKQGYSAKQIAEKEGTELIINLGDHSIPGAN